MRRLSRNGSQSSADRDPNSPKSPQKKRLHTDESPLVERAVCPLTCQSEAKLQNGDGTLHKDPTSQGGHSGPNSSCSCSDSCNASGSCSSSDDENHTDVNKLSPNLQSVSNNLSRFGRTKQLVDEELRNSKYCDVYLNNSCGSHHTSSRHSSIDENSDLEPHFIPDMVNDCFNLSEAENEVRRIIRQCSQVSVEDCCVDKVST